MLSALAPHWGLFFIPQRDQKFALIGAEGATSGEGSCSTLSFIVLLFLRRRNSIARIVLIAIRNRTRLRRRNTKVRVLNTFGTMINDYLRTLRDRPLANAIKLAHRRVNTRRNDITIHNRVLPHNGKLIRKTRRAMRISPLRRVSMYFVRNCLFLNRHRILITRTTRVRLVARLAKRNRITTRLRKDDTTGLIIKTDKRIKTRNRHQMRRTNTMLSMRPLRAINIITTPNLKRMVRRAKVVPTTAAKTTLGRRLKVTNNSNFRGTMRTRRMTIKRLLLLVKQRRDKTNLTRITIRVPLRVNSKNTIRRIARQLSGVVARILTNRIGSRLTTKLNTKASVRVRTPIKVNTMRITIKKGRLQLGPRARLRTRNI